MNLQEAIETAFAYHRDGKIDLAESIYDQLLCQITKPDPNVLFGYGTLLIAKERYGLGISLLQTAAQLAPAYAPLLTNLACAYKQIGKDDIALQTYERAVEMEPNNADILAGFSGFWINKNESQKVVDYALKALDIDPKHHAAHMHLGMGLLEQGKYHQAWPHYEHRWETLERVRDKRPYKAPMWDGKFVNTLAIHGEQGLGDEILYMSLLYKVRGLAENIVIECAERLIPTFTESFNLPCYKDHASLIAAHGEPDAYISMGSLPRLLGLPDGRPYLNRFKTKHTRPKIGIAWKGGVLRTNHKDRTIPVEDFKPILEVPGIDFVSVQYGSVAEELGRVGLSNDPVDFDSLQARIADCDLIISVCQTAVHQAGAMGVDCWVLVPEKTSWAFTGRDLRPWYKSIRFFRQEQGDWRYPIEMIVASLRERYASIAA